MTRTTTKCPSCSKETLFVDIKTRNKECYECGYNMSRITVTDLASLYFRNPMKIEDGFVNEGDHTNWEFFWAINYYITKILNRPLTVAGWQKDGCYMIKTTGLTEPVLPFVGATVEEAVENFLRAVLHEARRKSGVGETPSKD